MSFVPRTATPASDVEGIRAEICHAAADSAAFTIVKLLLMAVGLMAARLRARQKLSFVSKGDHGVDSHGSPCGNVAGQDCA